MVEAAVTLGAMAQHQVFEVEQESVQVREKAGEE